MLKNSFLAALVTALLVACSSSATTPPPPPTWVSHITPAPLPTAVHFSGHVTVHSVKVTGKGVVNGFQTQIREVANGSCVLYHEGIHAVGCYVISNITGHALSSTLTLFTRNNATGCPAGVGHYVGKVYNGYYVGYPGKEATFLWTGRC